NTAGALTSPEDPKTDGDYLLQGALGFFGSSLCAMATPFSRKTCLPLGFLVAAHPAETRALVDRAKNVTVATSEWLGPVGTTASIFGGLLGYYQNGLQTVFSITNPTNMQIADEATKIFTPITLGQQYGPEVRTAVDVALKKFVTDL